MTAQSFFTALPNLHPAVVHFPVALLVFGVVLDLAALVRRRSWLDRAAASSYVLGALGAGAAYLTGRRAEDGLGELAPEAQALVAAHADWALRTLLLFCVLALVRVILAWRDRGRAALQPSPVRLMALAVALAGQWVLFETADRGGALVYRHAVAIMGVPQGAPSRSEPTAPTAVPETSTSSGIVAAEPGFGGRWIREPDGWFRWTPSPSDTAALGSILEIRPGNATVRAVAPAPAGLTLEVAGSALLVFPDILGDVQLATSVDLSRFDGSVGLVHHHRSDAEFAAFEVTSDRHAVLVRVSGGHVERLDDRALAADAGDARVVTPSLQTSVAGRHWKGIVNGRTVVHGHGDPGAPGRVGLLLNGSGTLCILSFAAAPVGKADGD